VSNADDRRKQRAALAASELRNRFLRVHEPSGSTILRRKVARSYRRCNATPKQLRVNNTRDLSDEKLEDLNKRMGNAHKKARDIVTIR